MIELQQNNIAQIANHTAMTKGGMMPKGGIKACLFVTEGNTSLIETVGGELDFDAITR